MTGRKSALGLVVAEPQVSNISGGAFRSVDVLAIEAASALGPKTTVVFTWGGSKPTEIGLGLCRCRVCPFTVTVFSARQTAGADRTVLKRGSTSYRSSCPSRGIH